MNQELLSAITFIADEKKIPRDAVVEALKSSIIKAYTKEYPEELIEVNIDIDQKELSVNAVFNIVEDYEDLNDYCEMTVKQANDYYKKHKIAKEAKIGDTLLKPIELLKLPNKIVEHIMQLFKQAIVSESNIEIYNQWKDRIGEVVFAEVETNNKHGISVDLGNGEFGYVSLRETIPHEALIPGQKYNFYIKDVKQQSAGWPIILSRADAGLVKFLLKLEVPEIQEGIVEVVKIARIAGFKTKVALISHQPGVDPCGTVIGQHSVRISGIRSQVNGEQIEVFAYDDNFDRYISDVCAPASIMGYKVVSEATPEHQKQLIIIVKHEQMALLLGRKGSNIRLISKILDADVDVKTPEEAQHEDLQYTRVEYVSPRQRAFNRVYERNNANNSYDFSRYNKPRNNQFNRDINRNTANTAPAAAPANPQPVHKPTKSVKSILDQIDNFQNNSTNEVSVEIADAPLTKSTKKENLAKLMNNEQQRLTKSAETKKPTIDLEAVLDNANKATAPTKKPAKKFTKAKIKSKSTSSILEEFKNINNDELMEELANENDLRENNDEDSYVAEDDYSDYDDNK